MLHCYGHRFRSGHAFLGIAPTFSPNHEQNARLGWGELTAHRGLSCYSIIKVIQSKLYGRAFVTKIQEASRGPVNNFGEVAPTLCITKY